ncbi:hypothetical protein [Vibrio astriarenae]|uniref:hypothetical protein n=1 Tax=Vibrio astriarenae TaxID=1481923 RepID=UPI0037351DE6
MTTHTQQRKNSSAARAHSESKQCSSGMSQNVVYLSTAANSRKEKARAKLLRAAQKIRW